MSAVVSSLAIYPVKSIAGNPVDEALVEPIGFVHDRRYMIVRPDGTMVTGRTHPKTTAIRAGMDGALLTLACAGASSITLDPREFTERYLATDIWRSHVEGQECGAAADAWISNLLGEPLKLLYFGRDSKRHCRHFPNPAVSFADGFPMLLTSDASLAHLNSRLPAPVSMANFRPNITISGTLPWEEDGWAKIRIGAVEFIAPKPCSRCVFTTIDPHAHVADKGMEPLNTLSQYRKFYADGEVYFGENLIPLNEGVIRLGDKLEVLETKERPVYVDNWKPASSRLAQHLGGAPAEPFDGKPILLRCVQVIAETADVKTFKFAADPFRRFAYKPGQFLTLRLPIDGETVSRCYTISATPSRPDLLSVTVKRVEGGRVSNWMHDHIAVGSTVEATGPGGVFHLGLATGRKLLLLSGGSGITPMLSMIRFIADCRLDMDIRFHHSAHGKADLIAWEELNLLERQLPGLTLSHNLTQDTASDGYSGRISAEMLQDVCPDLAEREVFTCGPEGFMEAARSLLLAQDLPEERHHQESFTIETPTAPVFEGGTESFRLHFTKSNITVEINPDQPILEAAEAAGISVDFSCRAGMCGTCKSDLVSGEIDAPFAQALMPGEEEAGKFLPCCSFARTDLEVGL